MGNVHEIEPLKVDVMMYPGTSTPLSLKKSRIDILTLKEHVRNCLLKSGAVTQNQMNFTDGESCWRPLIEIYLLNLNIYTIDVVLLAAVQALRSIKVPRGYPSRNYDVDLASYLPLHCSEAEFSFHFKMSLLPLSLTLPLSSRCQIAESVAIEGTINFATITVVVDERKRLVCIHKDGGIVDLGLFTLRKFIAAAHAHYA